MNRNFSNEMKNFIEKTVGMPLNDIRTKDVSEIHSAIEKNAMY